jgi:2-amino-4-hydroxy-6-hydroxymethyldihydropteridine diphosphokinase
LTTTDLYFIYLLRVVTVIVESERITAYIGLGSNLGDRAGNLLYGVRGLIEASFVVTKLSPVYETEPIGIETDLPFLNMVAEIRSEAVTPTQMMARLLRIEYLLGRTDKSLRKPRTIDLDLLFFGNVRMDTPFLTIPHPRVQSRRFVLVPLNDVAPHFFHPLMHKDIRALLNECEDRSSVVRWNPMGWPTDAGA